ncbi:hypothetical protein HQ587_04015 [bacterium]|nr:hypothetical protein [bacterium]
MKRKRNDILKAQAEVNFIQSESLIKEPDEAEIRLAVNELPDPGPAGITASVMRKIQQEPAKLVIRRREFALGFAGSLAGVMLGLWLAGAVPDMSPTLLNGEYVAEFAELDDEIDQLAWEMSESLEDTQ